MSHPFHDGSDPMSARYPRHLNEEWLVGKGRDYGEGEPVRPAPCALCWGIGYHVKWCANEVPV